MTAASLTDTLAVSAPFYLSSYDVDRLMNDNSSAARLEIMHKVTSRYREGEFKEHELAIAEQIFRLMMKDVEIQVRKVFAEQIMDMDNAPRDVVMHLAQDIEEVALPVIQMSQVLSDADLVYLINSSKQTSVLKAITKRNTVSQRVSEALVETRYPDVVESLLANPKAKLDGESLTSIIETFGRDEQVMHSLAERKNLPNHVLEKLIAVASYRVAATLKDTYGLDATKLKQAEEKAREEVTLKMLEGHASDDEIDELVSEMLAKQRLSPSLIFTALCRGQLTFFVFALARLAHIPRNNAVRLVADKGGMGFVALYNKTGLPETMLDATQLVLQVVVDLKQQNESPGTRAYSNKLAQLLLMMAEDREVINMPYMLALIRNQR